jgi:hypothetical protein
LRVAVAGYTVAIAVLKWSGQVADLGSVLSILLRRYAVVGLVAVLVGGYVALHRSSGASSAGSFAGTTSQGLPISFTVTSSSVDSIMFTWEAVCADAQSHTNSIVLGNTLLAGGTFATSGTLDTGASSSVSGKIQGDTAAGVFSRSGPSVFGTDCTDNGVSWRAHRVGSH